MSPSERFSWKEPALCHYNLDLDKSWFAYFDYSDLLTGRIIRKQFRGQINRIHRKDAGD
jgi:hypothetical protein